MSMTTEVVGFRPPDAKWKRMKEVWDACTAACVDVPDEVDKFFDGEDPDPAGIKIDLKEHACCEEYAEDAGGGYEIDISKLPKNVTRIRFVNSW